MQTRRHLWTLIWIGVSLIGISSYLVSKLILNPSPNNGVAWHNAGRSFPWGLRDAGATAVHNGRIYLLGGWTFDKNVRVGMPPGSRLVYRETVARDLSDIWSTADGRIWEQSFPQWSHGMYGMATSFNGRLLYMGGLRNIRKPDESISSTVWGSEDGKRWVTLVPRAPWGPRIGSTLIQHDGRLWIFGGKSANNGQQISRLNDVWSSKDGLHWELVTQSAEWMPRAFHCAASFGGKMWLIGGGDWDSREAYSDIWSSSDGRNWTRHRDGPWPGRIWHSCVSFDDKLWVLGGRNLNPVHSVAEVWTTKDGDAWDLLPLPEPLGPRHAAYVTVFADTLWWLGGSADARLQADGWTYRPVRRVPMKPSRLVIPDRQQNLPTP